MLRVASFSSVFFFCSRTSKVRREKINEGEKKKKKKKEYFSHTLWCSVCSSDVSYVHHGGALNNNNKKKG